MESQIINDKIRVETFLNYSLKFIECFLFISILIFCYFILIGFLKLGHLPKYGDSEIANTGLNSFFALLMIYSMLYGIALWTIIMFIKLFFGFKRVGKNVLVGFILCLINILIMFTTQYEWIID